MQAFNILRPEGPGYGGLKTSATLDVAEMLCSGWLQPSTPLARGYGDLNVSATLGVAKTLCNGWLQPSI